MATKIQWTDETWNPVRGCSLVSAGCTHCYAMRQAHRFSGKGQPYEGLTRLTNRRPVWNGKVKLVPELLEQPLRWKKPRRIFVNSMSDLFHESVPSGFIAKVFDVMSHAPQHTFQILTKRSTRLRELADKLDWPANVWMGVSVENTQALYRLDNLRAVPAALRFLSCEPLISQLDNMRLDGIDWVIVGGESGPSARPCDVDWIRSIVEQCHAARVPVFVKQLGGFPVMNKEEWDYYDSNMLPVPLISAQKRSPHGTVQLSLNRKGDDPSEWPRDLRVREFPR